MAMARPKLDEARVLRFSRSFAAPPAQVFREFTEPQQLVRWWGPKGFTVPDCQMDVRPGGAWRTVMRSPEGTDHIVTGVYRELVPARRIVFTWAWESEGARGHETLVTIALEEDGAGTILHLTHELFETEDSRDQHQGGWSSTLECLADLLASEAP
jgi:uncharacterized protein YndB with AHSA1/START domain